MAGEEGKSRKCDWLWRGDAGLKAAAGRGECSQEAGGEGAWVTDSDEGRERDGSQTAGEGHPWEAGHHNFSSTAAGWDQGHQLGNVQKVAGEKSIMCIVFHPLPSFPPFTLLSFPPQQNFDQAYIIHPSSNTFSSTSLFALSFLFSFPSLDTYSTLYMLVCFLLMYPHIIMFTYLPFFYFFVLSVNFCLFVHMYVCNCGEKLFND